jgi:predicted ATPase/class 3 adenylate cyclase
MSDGSSAAQAGTVTFLFTDIEGSSRLEQRVGTTAYATIRERHRELLRTAFAAERGVEQGTAGDSLFVVFPTAAGAIRAAIVAQRALADEPWADDAAIRVRIGIHTGEAERSGADYVGIDINRAARIEAAAHGGQIVVSDATRALAGDGLDSTVEFLDLGRNKLKDFEPIRLHQVVAPAIQFDFPPLRSLDVRFINLQPAVSSFIGRAREVGEVSRLLTTTRMLTLTGPGGTGKTRLSIAAAQASLASYPAGAAWVGLSPIADPALVPTAIAKVLGVVDQGTRDLTDLVAERIGADRLLLLLDNFEQVLPAARTVHELLAACPGMTVLVTSREVLHLAGEREYPVQPLALPDPRHTGDLAALAANEAIALFVDRAQAVRPDFTLGTDNAAAVAAICARLDGLPLAIELAAARVRILAPAAIQARLDQSLGLLSGGARDLPERQQTLRGAIAWSYDLLSAAERTFFERLSVFAGGWSIETATVVADPDDELGMDALDGLTSLVEKSLVRGVETTTEEPRFRMLQTIREFGLERLTANGELAVVRDRHLQAIADLAEAAERQLIGADTKQWLDRLELEHDNVRAALRWALESGQAEIGMLTAGRLWRFWHQRGHLGEGLTMTRELLACPAGQGRTGGRVKALNGAGGLAYWRNDFPTAEGFYTEQLEVSQELGDKAAEAEAYYNLGYLAAIPGQHAVAIERYENALALWRELDDGFGLASGLAGLALVLYLKRDWEPAMNASREAQAAAERIGDRYRGASNLGVMGRIAMEMGDFRRSRSSGLTALDLFAESGDPTGLAMQLDDLGDLAMREGDAVRALRFGGASAALRARVAGGAPLTLTRHGDYIRDARAELGPARADAAWETGLALDQETAVARARAEFGSPADGAATGPVTSEAAR